jgi:oxygen-dependent protoporphyrinogen oxidase
VRTRESDGFRWEEGPEALPGNADAVRALGTSLGLELEEAPAAAARRYVLHEERLVAVPTSPPALLASPLFSLRGKLRLFSEPLRARGVALDGSIADFVRHRLGREFLERLVDPVVGGIHAGDAEQLSLRACFPEVTELVAREGTVLAALRARMGSRTGPPRALWKPRGGMAVLVEALARALGPRLVLGARVETLASEHGAWRVALADGGVLAAKSVVLATPLATARKLLAAPAPLASTILAAMHSESLVSVVHAWRRAEVAHALDGFGYLVPSRVGSPVLGTLFCSSLWPACAPEGTVLLRTLLGGAHHPALPECSDGELASETLRASRAHLGTRGTPLFTHVARYTAVIPRLDMAHPQRLTALSGSMPPGLHLLGNYTRGIGLARLVDEATRLGQRL